MPAGRSQLISLGLHVCFVALLLVITSTGLRKLPKPAADHYVLLAPPRLRIQMPREARGGGSNESLAPARRGALPVRAQRTFIPPATVPHPKIEIVPAIGFEAPHIDTALEQLGDPFGKLANGMFGRNGVNGIGDHGCCGGIGEGPNGPGFSPGPRAEPIRPAQVIYQPEPEFSEEARKAKFQGFVILMIEIGVDGRAHNIHIVQSPGLGLEEKAIEAVLKWRFRPAMRGSTPVATSARVEVNFHIF